MTEKTYFIHEDRICHMVLGEPTPLTERQVADRLNRHKTDAEFLHLADPGRADREAALGVELQDLISTLNLKS